MKAGLAPMLVRSILTLLVEATAGDTEVRLLKALRRSIPELPEHLVLVESLAALRRGAFLQSGQKALLVLDQFEQRALRHCDGSRLQCIVMVWDDFWLAVSRFMKVLEIELMVARNSALVDLFDPIHARKVLVAFGHAYGRLPDTLSAFFLGRRKDPTMT